MKCCKLFETLSKTESKLDSEHNPKSYSCTEECPWFGKCFYNVECPPKDPKLQNIIGGWQKYACYQINDKKCLLDWNGCTIINILHLMNPNRVSDIVIFRIAKKNKNDKSYSVRYVCRQGNKIQLCANITELNNYIDKNFEYSGRQLTQEDFKNV